MTDLAARVAALAAKDAARDVSQTASVRERLPEIAAWGDAIRRDLPGKWQAWSITADGVDLRGGNTKLWSGIWVDLTAPVQKVKRA
jgi:hypothetical protein